MLEKPSLITRIVVGKIVGLIFGVIGFAFCEFFLPETDWMLRWGILFWYTTMGAIIGVFGVITWHPFFKLPLPWWVRAPMVGGWMNFVLTFFAYDLMQGVLADMFNDNYLLTSPFWFVAEGAIVGLIIGYFATRFGGEGSATVAKHA